MFAKQLVALDAGHGGMTPDGKGRYVTAPNKMFYHPQRYPFHGKEFDHPGWFYEGVWNRMLTDHLADILAMKEIPFVKCYHPVLDNSLSFRVTTANYRKATLFISNHANASPTHRARGWEVFTSPGNTGSDQFATILHSEMRKKFPNIVYRTDTTDGDVDKEARFTVLTRTKMPSVLVENGFFDNYEDAVWLTENYRSIARVQADAIERYFAEISKKELEDNMK